MPAAATAPPGTPAGGRAGQGGGPPRAPRNAAFDGMAWGIDKWDAKKVEADLKARGMSPVEHRDGDFHGFNVKDPDGFDVWITNANRSNRRKGPAAGKTSAPAPFESTAWKTVWLDHISFEVTNYKETAAFYHALLGWKLGEDEGSQNTCEIGDIGNIIIRRGTRPGQPAPTARRASMGHISFGIAAFDPDKVKEELTKRGLNAREDTGGGGEIHTARYKSYHTTTPNGFDLQISATTKESRNVV
jgi:catechol 2,3-dioxygenase-like lactoylglutathione lyase family enzyme